MTIELVEKPYMTIKMDDGSLWAVPCRVIAEDRAKHYADDPDSSYQAEFDYTMKNSNELIDWAANNMNWKDVVNVAVKLNSRQIPPDYQEGWVNGVKDVVR